MCQASLICKGGHSSDTSVTLIKHYTNKCKNTTVTRAMSARARAKSAYICDQDPAEDNQEEPAEVLGAWQIRSRG